jgi:hypothetical protein
VPTLAIAAECVDRDFGLLGRYCSDFDMRVGDKAGNLGRAAAPVRPSRTNDTSTRVTADISRVVA